MLVAAYGTFKNLNATKPTFNATQVYVVPARSPRWRTGCRARWSRGPEIPLRFRARRRSAGWSCVVSSRRLPINIGSGTVVSIDGQPNATGVGPQSISIGQQIDAAGTATENSASFFTLLDVTQGLVRLQSTPLWGTLNPAAPGAASLNMLTLGGFAPTSFAFDGTGSTTASHADALNYLVNTGSIDLSATPVNTLGADGLVTPFGTAPPDFDATDVVAGLLPASPRDRLGERRRYRAISELWRQRHRREHGERQVHLGSSDITSRPAPVTLDLANPKVNVTIVPSPTLTGQFAIGAPAAGVVEFNSFAGLITEIGALLNGSNAFQRLVAVGSYNPASGTFTASTASICSGSNDALATSSRKKPGHRTSAEHRGPPRDRPAPHSGFHLRVHGGRRGGRGNAAMQSHSVRGPALHSADARSYG